MFFNSSPPEDRSSLVCEGSTREAVQNPRARNPLGTAIAKPRSPEPEPNQTLLEEVQAQSRI